MQTEERDYYEVLGAEPSASAEQLRAAFREAVLRHHPDLAPSSEVATRRTSTLNRAWAELRDPVRRLHYDRALEGGIAPTLEWPLEPGQRSRPARRRPRRAPAVEPSPWHQPQWRWVSGFRVPAEVFLAGPVAQERWIVEHHIEGEDWRDHTQRYWLRFASRYYAERGRTEDWLGALELMLDQDPPLAEIVDAGLREAYLAAGEELRGAMVVAAIAERHPVDDPHADGPTASCASCSGSIGTSTSVAGRRSQRAENAELLLNFLESLGLEPSFTDYRAAIVAHRRAKNTERATELVERVMRAPVTEAGRWFSLVQVLTEAGQVDRASTLLAEIARGEHPEALDPRRVANPLRRIATARERLGRARRRSLAAAG